MKKKEILKGYADKKGELQPELVKVIPLSKIVPPKFVERNMIDQSAIDELASNIKQVGLINPILVKAAADKFEIVAGHRRYLALRKLGAKEVRVVMVQGTQEQTEYLKLSENLLREDLNDVEEAQMLMRLKKITKGTEAKVAKQIGKSEGYVRQKLSILKYPERLFQALESGKITFSVSRELMRIKNENLLHEYLRHAIEGGATPALVKMWVDEILHQEKMEAAAAKGNIRQGETVQPTKHFYECEVCKEKADLVDSQLHRIHLKCWQEITS